MPALQISNEGNSSGFSSIFLSVSCMSKCNVVFGAIACNASISVWCVQLAQRKKIPK